jgi:hypothetical protein
MPLSTDGTKQEPEQASRVQSAETVIHTLLEMIPEGAPLQNKVSSHLRLRSSMLSERLEFRHHRVFQLQLTQLNGSSSDCGVGLQKQTTTVSPSRTSRVRGFRSSGLWRRVVLCYDTTSPWRWRQHGPPNQWYPPTTLHGVATQKTSTWL